jgi:hypothetical protein
MKRIKTWVPARLAAVLFAVVGVGVVALGANMFGKSVVLCSRFEGVLVDKDGTPQPGIRLDRTWNWGWKNEQGSDFVVTDAEGRFALPLVTGRSMTVGFLSHQPSIDQEIKAHGPAGDVVIWYHQKSNYDANGELSGRPIKVVCRIDQDPAAGGGLYYGTCVEAK